MTEKRQAADKGDKKADKDDAPKEESHLLKGIWGKVKHAGGVVADKTVDLANDAKDGIKEHGPKVVQGAKDAVNSPAGQKIKGAGENIVRGQIQDAKSVGEAAKNGDYDKVIKKAAPLVIGGPAAYIGKEVAGQVINEGVKQLPPEHQGTAKQVQKGLQLKDAVTGNGFPSGQNLIIDAATDPQKQNQVKELGKKAVDGVSGFWNKMTGGGDKDADEKKADVKKAASKPNNEEVKEEVEVEKAQKPKYKTKR